MDNAEFLSEQSKRLNDVILQAEMKFSFFSEEEWSEKKSSDKWSRKEIIGHLIDSAANNHLRFVRAQVAAGEFISHKYEQNFFVSSQRYQDRSGDEVVSLWKAYNLHLAHVIRNLNADKLGVICKIGDYEPVTLSFLVKDYIDHIDHHLEQIYG